MSESGRLPMTENTWFLPTEAIGERAGDARTLPATA
jgi:hypothetical protein